MSLLERVWGIKSERFQQQPKKILKILPKPLALIWISVYYS
jgi:hypothetical protein